MAPFAHTIGSRYEGTKDLDIAEVAKLIRKDIKAAVKTGDLPADAKYSVRIQRYSLGQSIDVRVMLPRWARVRTDHDWVGQFSPTPEAARIQRLVQGIVDAYNWDNSDVLSDYHASRFHSSTTIYGTEG